jgi:hypothetical protein
MDFINLFKFSNYIVDKTDALLARYGHVNTLADILMPPVATVDAESTLLKLIELNTTLGIIKNFAGGGNNPGMSRTVLTNNLLTENSIIFYKFIPSNTAELSEIASDLVCSRENTTNDLHFTMKRTPPTGGIIQGDIHFWIINPINQ